MSLPLPPLLFNSSKHCLMAHELCTFLLGCAHVFQVGVQTSNSCRNKAKKGGGLSATKRPWILEIQQYKNKHFPLSCNRSSLALANQALWQQSPFLCQSCAPVLLDSHGAITDFSPALLSGCLQGKVGVWPLPLLAFSSLHQRQNKAICNYVQQAVVMLCTYRCLCWKAFFHLTLDASYSHL